MSGARTMAEAGQTIENPVTGERITFRKTASDTGGELFQMDVELDRGGFIAAEHVHPAQEERFEVIEGKGRFRVDGVERDARPGEVVVVPPGTPHTFWNPAGERLRVRSEYRPALESTELFFETYFGLARDGKVNANGMVGNPFQVAVLGRAYSDYLRLTRPPWPVQRALFTLLAPLGRLLGHRASYPKYSGS